MDFRAYVGGALMDLWEVCGLNVAHNDPGDMLRAKSEKSTEFDSALVSGHDLYKIHRNPSTPDDVYEAVVKVEPELYASAVAAMSPDWIDFISSVKGGASGNRASQADFVSTDESLEPPSLEGLSGDQSGSATNPEPRLNPDLNTTAGRPSQSINNVSIDESSSTDSIVDSDGDDNALAHEVV